MQKRSVVAAALLGLAAAAPAGAQEAPALELRAGVVASTPLAEEADPGDASVSVGAAPMLSAVFRQPLGPELAIEVSGGWTFGRMSGASAAGDWEGPEVGVGHAVVSARKSFGSRTYARAGVGALRYSSEDAELFRGDGGLKPLLEAGVGAGWPLGPLRVTLDLLGQAHTLDTDALQAAGGESGTVLRGALLLGVMLLEGGR